MNEAEVKALLERALFLDPDDADRAAEVCDKSHVFTVKGDGAEILHGQHPSVERAIGRLAQVTGSARSRRSRWFR